MNTKAKVIVGFFALSVTVCWGQYYRPYGQPPTTRVEVQYIPPPTTASEEASKALQNFSQQLQQQEQQRQDNQYRQQLLQIERERNQILNRSLNGY